MSMTGNYAGTPFFMPHEQITNSKYVKPVLDVWSFATSRYQLFTGKFPYRFDPKHDPIDITRNENPVPIRDRMPSLEKKLAAKGFSLANIWRMRQFYLAHNEPEFLAQVVRDFVSMVPWDHHVLMLGRMKSPAEHFWYLRATARFGGSRKVLLNQIKGSAYERAVTEKKTHNFDLTLPVHFTEQADEMLKSSYSLDFLGLGKAVKERELEDPLVSRLQAFLLELGYGFCFFGRQHRIIGKKEYFIDLLFISALQFFRISAFTHSPLNDIAITQMHCLLSSSSVKRIT